MPLEDRQLLSMFPVTSTADDGSTGTLRWAVAGANADTSPSTIVFEPGTAAATITLTQGILELSNASESVTISDGTGQGPVTVSGNNKHGAFQVDSGVTASISGLTITGGATLVQGTGEAGLIDDLGTLTLSDCTITINPQTTTGSGVIVEGAADISDCTISGGNSYYGGGVDVLAGTADITGCAIDDNTGFGQGGGVCNFGTTTLVNCTISGNSEGGGLYNSSVGQLKVYGSTISGNTGNEGAGVYNMGTAYLSGCTISGNSNESFGGGVGNGNLGTIDLSGCTISGNDAAVGGGLENDGAATITDCTISRNTVYESGGGVSNGVVDNTAVLTLTDSTISGNTDQDGDTSRGGGAGVINNGKATLTDSTIADNVADSGTLNGGLTEPSNGGGLDDSGTATLVACTVSGNTTNASGGGIYVGGTGADTLTINNTIVAANDSAPTGGSVSPSDIAAASGTVVSGSNDLVGTGGSAGLSSSTNKLGVADPDLAPLGSNGGTTETMALLPHSPAIAAGSVALEVGPGGTALTTDQRGQPLDTPVPDIGAYQTAPPISLSFSGLTSPSISYGTASVTISGTLASGSQAPPDTESVQITLDGVTQRAAISTGGAFSTSFETSTLPASATPYTVTYSYAGDANFAATTTTSTATVSQATPTVNVTDPSGIYKDSAFTATTTVTGVGGRPAPSLEGVTPMPVYFAGATAAGTPRSGAPIDGGTYTVVARFPGSADYSAVQSAPVTFTIGRASAKITLASSGGSAVYGQPVTLVTTVAGAVPAAGTPTGSVTFFDGATALATVPLDSSGRAALTTSLLAVGSHTITATYNTTANFLGVESGSASESVAQAGTEVVLAPQPVFKKKQLVSVNLKAEIVPLAPGGGVPTGVVAFELLTKKGKKIHTQTLGRVSVQSDQATLRVKANSVLNKSLTIVYGGDTDVRASTATSPKLTQKGLDATRA